MSTLYRVIDQQSASFSLPSPGSSHFCNNPLTDEIPLNPPRRHRPSVRSSISHLTTDHLTIPAAFNEQKKNGSSAALQIFSGLPFFSGKRCKRRRKRQLELINDFLVCPRRWRGSERTGVAGREIVPLARKEKRARNKKGRRIIFVSFYLLAPAFYKIVFRLLPPPASHLRFK